MAIKGNDVPPNRPAAKDWAKERTSEEARHTRTIFHERHNVERQMANEIIDVMFSYRGRVTLAAMFGVLEFVRQDLVEDFL